MDYADEEFIVRSTKVINEAASVVLEVPRRSSVPKVRGFKPDGRSRRIFQGEKKKSSVRLPSDGN
jgi:hypothetical protein